MKKVLFLFGVLEHQDIEWLIEEGKFYTIPANHHLIDKGQETNYMYIVLAGNLAVYDFTINKTPLATISQGEILGELSFIDALPPSATVIAKREVELLRIEKETIRAKLKKDKPFAARFYYSLSLLLSHRLRNKNNGATAEDELGSLLMDNLHQAGNYFRQVVKEVRLKANV